MKNKKKTEKPIIINKPNSNIDTIFNQTKAFWDTLVNENSPFDTINTDELNKFPLFHLADITRSTISIYNYKDLFPEFITDNVKEILGFSKEDYLAQGSKLLFKHLDPSHIDFPLTASKCFETVFKNLKKNKNNNILATSCGLKFIHVKKGIIRLLIQQYFFETKDNKIPTRVISTIQDVTHFMKGDYYALRIVSGENHQNKAIYHSQNNKLDMQSDIISNRELEILQLIEQGHDTDAIAKILSISRNTVNNHRQNMLDRLGAKDTTSLIELVRVCHII